MGEPKIGIDILQEIESDYITAAKTGLDVGSGYYYYLAKASIDLGKNKEAIKYLSSFIDLFDQLVIEKAGNEFHLWTVTGKRMVGKSLLALAYAREGNNKKSLDLIETIINEIPNQPRLYYENSIEILNNIGEAYKKIGKPRESEIYYEKALNELNRIAAMLNNDDRNMFFNNIKINKNIKSLAS
tara:strand:- start:58 stop:612 length:555 start_codon:yes stop_codon:yes gene_type:complete